MLDRYYWGAVTRISPEAPVPVVEIESESVRLGGAANVANNIAALGGVPILVGVVGADDNGMLLRNTLQESGFPADGIVTDPSRPTTIKTRVIAHHQHVVRIDHEVRHDISPSVQDQIVTFLKQALGSIDAIIIEDYNKGVMTKELIPELVRLALGGEKIITIDPKFNNFFEYKNVTVFKPNRQETETALGCRLRDTTSVEQAGTSMIERLQAESVLLTRGEEGMSLFEAGGEITHVPTRARKVADVSGAGDTVIATLTIALAAGATTKEASSLANDAGGIVCGEVGIVPVDREGLFRVAAEHSNHDWTRA
jgi:rfaE bifunctional protein kinase chain/domain